jgi:hypothetical protein
MSNLLPRDQYPPGIDKGNFVPLDAVEFRKAYATVVETVIGVLPPDPDFTTEYQDAISGEARRCEDTPINRGIFKASKLFDDDAKRISFMFRFNKVMPIALEERKYAKYRNAEGSTMHLALLAAVAGMPFSQRTTTNQRTTTKMLRATLDAAFRNALAVFEPRQGEQIH